jgi:TPR repeat protein
MVPDRLATWITALLLMLFSALAEADVAAGIAAYQGGDFVAALREFQEAAKHDDIRALNFLGIMHAEGLGTLRDDRQATDMFYKAAILGYPEAMVNLARMYAAGRGGQQDKNAPVSLYRAAAKAGFQPAIIRMAEIYENGEFGEAPDAVLAREWRARLQGQQTQAGDSSRLEGSAPVQNTIEAVAVSQQVGQILIRVSTTVPLAGPPTSFTVANPPRIAFDFPNIVIGRGNARLDIGEGDLRLINVVQVNDRTRMVLTLRKIMQHDAKVDGRDLLITLTSTGRASD